MIHFFGNPTQCVYTVQTTGAISPENIQKLSWLFGNQSKIEQSIISNKFIGPRTAMITPWSTNAVEITQNMGIQDIVRIERFDFISEGFSEFDPMISQKYTSLNQDIFTIDITPEAIKEINDINLYNKKEGLALNDEEIEYLENLSEKLFQKFDRKITDSEVFGFSQINSEHCRHKIFNGTFIIDGEEMPS